ncbi:hypothetical protein GCM10007350_33660 [Jeongeupia chitinilytica]|uniref:Uncharacterized protein n=1 Tax=Jeongeupia chitinilytica TaxID=1041641 RepID=A0ABQ3H6F5_9NEIS|nr:hypothetical protein GCM10007350_33660 [Jeongeupia chitinilytica]
MAGAGMRAVHEIGSVARCPAIRFSRVDPATRIVMRRPDANAK